MLDWRSIISSKTEDINSQLYAQNTHNTQNPTKDNSFADIADIAYIDSNLKNRLYYGLTIETLKINAGSDWNEIKNDNELLDAFAGALSDIFTREKGEIPPSYTSKTICANCGEIAIHPSLVCGGYVLGCPWCFNKAKGLPIPKLDQIRRRSIK